MRRAAASIPAPPFTSCVRTFEEEFDYLYRALRRHGVNRVDAEDLVQDVFVVMWRRWADFEADRPLRPWLAGIAFRVARHHRRRNGREVPGGDLGLEADLEPPPSDEHDPLAAADARDLVLRVLARLPERHRTPIVLHDLDGVPVEQIADALGVPASTVYTRVRRARLAFAKLVDRVQRTSPAVGGIALAPETLLALERSPAAAPAPARHRAQERARRAVVLLAAGGSGRHDPRVSAPARGGPPSSSISGPAIAAGLAVTAAALLTILLWPPRAPAGAARVADPAASPRPRPLDIRLAAAAHALPRLTPAAPGEGAEPSVEAALSRGLAGYWRLDESPGSTVARDQSGHGRDCLLRGIDPHAAWGDGALGGALRLTGRGWLECPQPPVEAGTPFAMTVAAWVQPSPTISHRVAIATRQMGRGSDDLFFFGFEAGGKLRVMSKAWIGWVTRMPVRKSAEQWVHVAFTRNADGNTHLFVGGNEVGQMYGKPRGAGLVDGPLTIGAGINGVSTPSSVRQRFEGSIDELLVYDRALSGQEIAALAARAEPSPR